MAKKKRYHTSDRIGMYAVKGGNDTTTKAAATGSFAGIRRFAERG